MAVFISDEVHFRAMNGARDQEGPFVVIKESLHQEDVIILNAYASKISASKCMKQKLIELSEEIHNHMIIV